MRIIYSSPNMENILTYITNKLANNDDLKDWNPESYIHPFMIIRVNKKNDSYLHSDMFRALLFSGSVLKDGEKNSIEIVETIKAYYLSMSVQDIIRLKEYDIENIFIDKFRYITESMPITDELNDGIKTENIFSRERIKYPIESHPKTSFHVLNDTRYFVRDYINILEAYSDLTRDTLNILYRVVVWIKMPIFIARDIIKDFHMTTNNAYRIYGGFINFHDNDMDKHHNVSLKLSQLSSISNVNPELITFDTNVKDIQTFISVFHRYIRYNDSIPKELKDEVENVLTVSTNTDLFITISVNRLSKFLDSTDTNISCKSYYQYLNAIGEMLLYNNYKMEFILKGIRRN